MYLWMSNYKNLWSQQASRRDLKYERFVLWNYDRYPDYETTVDIETQRGHELHALQFDPNGREDISFE